MLEKLQNMLNGKRTMLSGFVSLISGFALLFGLDIDPAEIELWLSALGAVVGGVGSIIYRLKARRIYE